jgi:hypothetical protein
MKLRARLARTGAVIGMCAATGACHWGTRLHKFPPAASASGARVAIRVVGEQSDHLGELYAAPDSGLILGETVELAGRPTRLVFVPWNRLSAMDVWRGMAEFDVRPGEPLTPEKRSRINAISRFPQGLSGDLLQAVLTKLELSTVDRVDGGRELDELAAAATAAAMPYRDRNEAIRAGYRRVGSDFPAMGEHWILPTALLEGRVDPARPPMLIYASIGDRPTLLGVGFVVTLRGRTQPEGLIGWPTAWHEHSGLLDDESLAKKRQQDNEASRTRVWVLHAWTQLKNPDGQYAAENWALPFARAGVRVIGTPPREAAEALALAVGGEEHLRARLRAASNDDRPATGIDDDIERARAEAQSIMRRWSADSIVSESDLEALALTWRSLRATLIAAIGPSAATALGAVDAGHNHAGSGKP